jgi:hypothetical protein
VRAQTIAGKPHAYPERRSRCPLQADVGPPLDRNPVDRHRGMSHERAHDLDYEEPEIGALFSDSRGTGILLNAPTRASKAPISVT